MTTKSIYLVTYRGKWASVKGAALAFGTEDDANDYIDREVKRMHTTRRRFKVIRFVKQMNTRTILVVLGIIALLLAILWLVGIRIDVH
jgi:hypothetical protein